MTEAVSCVFGCVFWCGFGPGPWRGGGNRGYQ